jgi:uncharacterized membrane protein HdeD (DUF308 family)
MTTATMETKQRPWWLVLIGGILAVIVGALLLFSGPVDAARTWVVLVQVLGIWWLISGIFDIVYMFFDHTAWGWKLFIGIVSILAGTYILRYPLVSAVALPKILALVLGIWGLIYGVVLLIMAFKGGGWGAGILGGLGIIFGIILIANWANLGSGLAMIWAVAIVAFIGGILQIIQAFRQRGLEKA